MLYNSGKFMMLLIPNHSKLLTRLLSEIIVLHSIQLLLLVLNKGNAPKGREDYILTTDEMQMNDYPLPADDSHQADKSKDNGMDEK